MCIYGYENGYETYAVIDTTRSVMSPRILLVLLAPHMHAHGQQNKEEGRARGGRELGLLSLTRTPHQPRNACSRHRHAHLPWYTVHGKKLTESHGDDCARRLLYVFILQLNHQVLMHRAPSSISCPEVLSYNLPGFAKRPGHIRKRRG